MEEIKNSKTSKLVIIMIGALFGLIVFPSNIKSIVILLFGISVLIMVLQRKWVFNKKFFLTNAFTYILIVFTIVYSDNMEYTQRKLINMSSLFIFPLIFSLFTEEEGKIFFKRIQLFLTIYVVGVFLYNVLPFIWFYATHYTWSEMITHYITIIRTHMGKFNIHPIYMSMHCSIAILFSFYILRELQSKIKIAAVLAIDISLVLFLLLYAKKGPLIALIIVFSLFVVFQRKQKLLKPYLIAIITLIFLTIAIPTTRNKFVELLKIEHIDQGEVTSTNIRYTIYETAQNLVLEAPFTGYGIGDYNDTLIKRYEEEGNQLLADARYNAHNQYLSLLLIGGIVLLLVFIFMIGMNLVYAIRFNNQILILFLVFYAIVMFTENILERESGIIFFAFFLNFFGLKSLYARGEN